ncbi:hypothetical protein ACFPOE_04055 [Caenimonas terrae]|uniref:Glycosyltransferase family 2 protein n=1 Tax=Caenimonas terrae TaxID=696074 RepID=A0ABW0NA22_9BURK
MTDASNGPLRPAEILAVVVNWNGWQDTLECIRSLCAMTEPRLAVLVCDNGSSDGSIEHLVQALRADGGAVDAAAPGDVQGQVMRLGRCAQKGGGAPQDLYLMPIPSNLGYAGALNKGIEWGRQQLHARGFWLLNNDVKVEPDALAHLVAATQRYPDMGLCGSVLLEWEEPLRVQAIAGVFRKYLAVGWHTKAVPAGAQAQSVLFDIDYPVGASLYVTEEYLQRVGPMDDGYFLYYEELDWCERGRAQGFRPAVALQSRVRHKEGASTGSTGGVRRKSMLSEYYGVLNRLRYTRKFSPHLLPVVWLSLLLLVADRVIHGEWARAGLVMKLMLHPRSVARP